MSITKLGSGRLRVQVYDPATGRNVSAATVLGFPHGHSWPNMREAKAAREQARAILYGRAENGPTVKEFWAVWTTDPIYARPKDSTNIHLRERTARFVDAHADLPIRDIGDEHVARWLAGGKNTTTIPALRAMFNDAASAKAGRLIERSPFNGLGVDRPKSRAAQQPPSIELAAEMVESAHRVSVPSFAGWLQCAMWSGLRPGELDALKWHDIDLRGGWISVQRQWNAKTRSFTAPKNGLSRPVPLTGQARRAITGQPRVDEFVFLNLHNGHWTPSGRAYHWKAVKAAVGWEQSLYLATRHFAGWVMYDQLRLDAEDVAFALGHTDGGQLVRQVYGHRDRDAGLQRVAEAYRRMSRGPTTIRKVA